MKTIVESTNKIMKAVKLGKYFLQLLPIRQVCNRYLLGERNGNGDYT